jgi:chromosome segregation ATPase
MRLHQSLVRSQESNERCEQALDDSRKLQTQTRAELSTLQNTHSQLSKQHEELRQRHMKLMEELGACRAEMCASQNQWTETLTGLQKDMQSALQRKDTQLQEAQTEADSHRQQLNQLRTQLSARNEHETKCSAQLDSLKAQIQQLTKDLKEACCRRQEQNKLVDDLKSRLISALNEGVEAGKQLTNSARLQSELLAAQDQVRAKEADVRHWMRTAEEEKESKLALENEVVSSDG